MKRTIVLAESSINEDTFKINASVNPVRLMIPKKIPKRSLIF